MTWPTMFGAFSTRNRPASTARDDEARTATLHAQLLTLLQQDEFAFNLEFENLDDGTKKRLVRQTGPGSLMYAALATDRADAVMLMRPESKRAWALGYNAYSNARLTQVAIRTQQPFLTAALHERGLMHDTTLEAALRIASPQALMALVRVNRVPYVVLQSLLPVFAGRLRGDTLRTWLSHAQISTQSYVQTMAPNRSPEQGEALLRDIAAHAGAPRALDALTWLEPNFEQVITWLAEGLVTGADALAALPDLSREQVIELFQFGFIHVDQYVASGCAHEKDLREFVAQRRITAELCMTSCSVPEALARTWWQQGLINSETYAEGRGRCWTREDPLPAVHVQRVQRARDINAQLLLLPAPADATARHTMRLRLYAEWVAVQNRPSLMALLAPIVPPWMHLDAGAHQLVETGHWLAQGLASLGASLGSIAVHLGLGRASSPDAGMAASAPAAEVVSTCFACTDAIDDDEPAVALAGCQHPAMLHARCLRSHAQARLERGYTPNCPVQGCTEHVDLNQGLSLGLAPDLLDALALCIIAPYRTPHWKPCPTEGCVSGANLPPRHGLMRECAMCEKHVTLTDLDEDLMRMREVALMMIEDMGDNNEAAPQTRPCYHCGHATTRAAGCTHMVCGRDTDNSRVRVRQQGCNQTWDFIRGAPGRGMRWGDDSQRYVPRSGEMVRAGLFDPLPPGFLHMAAAPLPGGHASLQSLARANARRLGWLPPTP